MSLHFMNHYDLITLKSVAEDHKKVKFLMQFSPPSCYVVSMGLEYAHSFAFRARQITKVGQKVSLQYSYVVFFILNL
jgi:hypothetical protein